MKCFCILGLLARYDASSNVVGLFTYTFKIALIKPVSILSTGFKALLSWFELDGFF